MSKVYITSKSKTFEKEARLYEVMNWISLQFETPKPEGTKFSKYKITITNLK